MATNLLNPTAPSRSIPTGEQILGLPQQGVTTPGPDRSREIAGSVQTGGTDKAAPVQQALANIINTGKAKPPQATLIDPKTGDRLAVDVGSSKAQDLFGAGWVLEQSEGTPAAGAKSATTGQVFSGTEQIPKGGVEPVISNPTVPTAPVTQSKLEFLRSEANKTKAEAFSTAYGYTPDEWQNQPPEVQRQLRNQRIQGLAAQYGNYSDAITQVKEETKTAKADAITSLNLFLESGVLGKIGDAELSSLASAAGISMEGLKAIANKGDGYELKQLGDQLVTIKTDPETGQISIADSYAPPKTSGSGSGKTAPGTISYATINGQSYPSDFVEYYKTYIEPANIGVSGPISPNIIASEFKKWSDAKLKTTPVAPRERYTKLQQLIEAGSSLPSLLQEFTDISSDEIRSYYEKYYKST